MSKNIEIQINTGTNTYEVLYPKTLGSLIDGTVTNAANAILANMASTLSSTLEVSKGGTGVTTMNDLAANLGSYFNYCSVQTKSYTGDGIDHSIGSNPLTFSFPFKVQVAYLREQYYSKENPVIVKKGTNEYYNMVYLNLKGTIPLWNTGLTNYSSQMTISIGSGSSQDGSIQWYYKSMGKTLCLECNETLFNSSGDGYLIVAFG